ncbi:MAG: hypothetical protein SNJ61_06625, partial [Fimbriimonadaceae bacterium]
SSPVAGRQPPIARRPEFEGASRSGFGGPGAPGYLPPGPPIPGAAGDPTPASGDSRTEVVLAWLFGILGLFCCVGFSIAGIVLAAVARKKGQPGANLAMIVCIATTVISVVGVCGAMRLDF